MATKKTSKPTKKGAKPNGKKIRAEKRASASWLALHTIKFSAD